MVPAEAAGAVAERGKNKSMIKIDIKRCNGCSSCVEACPQQAIAVEDDLAVINQERWNQCGICSDVCPVGAINDVAISEYSGKIPIILADPFQNRQLFMFVEFRAFLLQPLDRYFRADIKDDNRIRPNKIFADDLFIHFH